MDKLKVPQTRMVDERGNVTPHWERFFEAITKGLKVNTVFELGTGDAETNGNWRLTQSGNNLVTQRLESGTWTTKDTVTP